jgi:microcystin-dependent protein
MGITSFSQQTVNAGLTIQVPAGVISQFAGSTAPNGYLVCDGAAVSRSTYSDLFNSIGTTYGNGNGSTTFNIPNFQGRVPVGVGTAPSGSGVSAKALATTGGNETVTLTTANMAAHTHSGSTGTESSNHTHGGSTGTVSADHSHSGPGWSDAVSNSGNIFYTTNRSFNNYGSMTTTGISANHIHSFSTGGVTSNHIHSFSTDNGTGSATPVPNLQPYIVVNYIIKT